MPKRFNSTEIWDEDWFLEMPTPYKLFWYYMLCSCNHAGIFRVNTKAFCALNEVKVTPSEASKFFNNGKQRIRYINESTWLIEDFFVYQYGNTMNVNNRVHQSVIKEYTRLGIEIASIRGLNRSILDLNDGVKDKDKDKEIVTTSTKKADKEIRSNLFEQFWNAYANKKSKGTAEKAWERISIDLLPMIVKAALDFHTNFRNDFKYYPNPASWLNARKWEDEPDTTKTISPPKIYL